ncbi:MAG: M48 family metalloprotease [Spirochaetaceae bacterium]|jgi:predicted Zn-dependent protease|nr:M48 family metalloprotease [Spirochaetaceae bacterium]
MKTSFIKTPFYKKSFFKKAAIRAFLVMAFFAVSCSSLSIDPTRALVGAIESGMAWSRASEDFTPEQEYYLGRAVGANILSFYTVYTARPALTNYVNRICQTIAINSPQPDIYNGYHVAILDSDEINGFATSGGHIFLTRGLIACAESEDALAAVIAHEIAHILLQHSLEAIKKSRKTQAILTTAGSIAGAIDNENIAALTDAFGESIQSAISTMVNSGYAQEQEFDADKTALALLADAGYDPAALIEMLTVLKTNQGRQPNKGFAKTHPSPQARIDSAASAVSAYAVNDTRSFRNARFRQSM